MRETSTNRAGEIITREDERQLLDTVQKWLDRDVRDKVLELEHADDYPHEMVEQMKALGVTDERLEDPEFDLLTFLGYSKADIEAANTV